MLAGTGSISPQALCAYERISFLLLVGEVVFSPLVQIDGRQAFFAYDAVMFFSALFGFVTTSRSLRLAHSSGGRSSNELMPAIGKPFHSVSPFGVQYDAQLFR